MADPQRENALPSHFQIDRWQTGYARSLRSQLVDLAAGLNVEEALAAEDRNAFDRRYRECSVEPSQGSGKDDRTSRTSPFEERKQEHAAGDIF